MSKGHGATVARLVIDGSRPSAASGQRQLCGTEKSRATRAVIRIRVRRVIFGGISGAPGRLARSVARQPLSESIDRLEQQTEYWLRQSLRGGPVPRAPAPVRRGPVRGDPVVAVPTFHRS